MCFILTPVRLLPGTKCPSLSKIKTRRDLLHQQAVNPSSGQKFVFHATEWKRQKEHIRSVSHSPDYLAS